MLFLARKIMRRSYFLKPVREQFPYLHPRDLPPRFECGHCDSFVFVERPINLGETGRGRLAVGELVVSQEKRTRLFHQVDHAVAVCLSFRPEKLYRDGKTRNRDLFILSQTSQSCAYERTESCFKGFSVRGTAAVSWDVSLYNAVNRTSFP